MKGKKKGRTQPLKARAVLKLSQTTHFSEKEIKRLSDRFHALSHETPSGVEVVSKEIFCGQPEVILCPLMGAYLDRELHGNHHHGGLPEIQHKLTFTDYCHILSMWSQLGTDREKVKIAAQLLRQHHAGLVHPSEFFRLYKQMYLHVASDETIGEMVSTVIKNLGGDPEKGVSQQRVLKGLNLRSKLTIYL